MRRVITIAIISVIISVIVSYVIAAACMWLNRWSHKYSEIRSVDRVNQFGDLIASKMPDATSSEFSSDGLGLRFVYVFCGIEADRKQKKDGKPFGSGARFEAGWPFRCVVGWHFEDERTKPSTTYESGLWTNHSPNGQWSYYPFRPLWRGLALNALVMCIPAWCVMWLVGPVRRSRRRARGLCVHCRYNLKGIESPQCPECGRAR